MLINKDFTVNVYSGNSTNLDFNVYSRGVKYNLKLSKVYEKDEIDELLHYMKNLRKYGYKFRKRYEELFL